MLDHGRSSPDARAARAPRTRGGRIVRLLRHRLDGDRRPPARRTDFVRDRKRKTHPGALPSDVRRLLARFDELNPYDRQLVRSPWKAEADSLTRELWCYAISAKRYCLYRPTENGAAEIVAALDADPGDDEGPSETQSCSRTGRSTALGSTSTRPPATRTGRGATAKDAASGSPRHGSGSFSRPKGRGQRCPRGPRHTRSPASPSPARHSSAGSQASTASGRGRNKSGRAVSA
jgi:hypothetical protein